MHTFSLSLELPESYNCDSGFFSKSLENKDIISCNHGKKGFPLSLLVILYIYF